MLPGIPPEPIQLPPHSGLRQVISAFQPKEPVVLPPVAAPQRPAMLMAFQHQVGA